MALVGRIIENQDIFSLSIISIIFLILICGYEKISGILFLACFLLTLNLSDLLPNSALIRTKGFKELTLSPSSSSSCLPLVTSKQLLLNMSLFHHSCRQSFCSSFFQLFHHWGNSNRPLQLLIQLVQNRHAKEQTKGSHYLKWLTPSTGMTSCKGLMPFCVPIRTESLNFMYTANRNYVRFKLRISQNRK